MLIEVCLFFIYFRQSFCANKYNGVSHKMWKQLFVLQLLSIYRLREGCKRGKQVCGGRTGEETEKNGICDLLCAHIYHCLRQSGFNDDIICVSSHCEEQFGEKHYWRCPFMSPPTSLDVTSNHIHLWICCNNAPQPSTFGMNACETQGVNWTLEGAVQTVREFFGQCLCTEGLSGFRVIQKEVCCPFSIYSLFCTYRNSFTSIDGQIFLETFKKEWTSDSD